jgi:hypothetical protein
MRRSLSFAAATAGLTVVLTGCSNSNTGTAAPSSAASSSSAVASASQPVASASPASAASWVDGYCGSLLGFVDLSNLEQPSLAPGDTAGGKQALIDTFSKVESAVGSAVDGLTKLPAAPVAAGEAAKKNLVAVFTPVLQKVKDLEAKLKAAPAGDAQSLLDASKGFEAIGTDMNQIDDPMKEITASPELEAARQASPNCQKLPQ